MEENVAKQVWSNYSPMQKRMIALGCATSVVMMASPPVYILMTGVSTYRWNRLFKNVQKKGINWEEAN